MFNNRALLEGDVSKPKNIWATLGRFWQYFRQYGLMLVLVGVMVVLSTWTQVVAPEYIGQAVDCYLAPNAANCWYATSDVVASDSAAVKLGGLGQIVLILVLLYIAGAILSGLSFYLLGRTGSTVLRDMRRDLFRQFHRLSLGFYSKNEAGDLMSRVTSDSDTIQQVFSFALLSVLSGILLIGWIIIRMFQTNVPYALISLSVVPFMVIATVYFSNQSRRMFRISRKEMGSVNADLQEGISGAREVQAFNREEESIEEFRRTNAANRDANVRAASFSSALNPVLEALGYVAIAVAVVAGGISVLRNEPLLGTSIISLGTVFAFVQYSQRFSQPIVQIAQLWTNIQNAIAGGERIFGLLDTVPDVQDKPDAMEMPQIQGRVDLEDVKLEYVPGQPVLKGVSLHADPGQTIAIVGPTGAGKTTIINLLPRFYDTREGSVKIDGHDVRDVTSASLRRQIGIVLQDTFLFSDTVMNNIRYGRLDATDEEVIAAAKLVQADAFIERLENGYETVLGERGAGLSQGQRQLIAIARVALMDPRILILDEATSSVDTRTERLIQKAFEKLLAGRTSFVIAHRLSTIRNADKVLMLRDGQIIEQGTHNELLAQGGAYYDLYMSQFRVQDETVAPVNGSSNGVHANGAAVVDAQPSGD